MRHKEKAEKGRSRTGGGFLMAGIPGLEPGPRRFRHMAQSPSMAFGHSGKHRRKHRTRIAVALKEKRNALDPIPSKQSQGGLRARELLAPVPCGCTTKQNKSQKKMVGREGGETGCGHLSLMATEGGCASTRGHSANLECSFEVREGRIWVLNRKVKLRVRTRSINKCVNG